MQSDGRRQRCAARVLYRAHCVALRRSNDARDSARAKSALDSETGLGAAIGTCRAVHRRYTEKHARREQIVALLALAQRSIRNCAAQRRTGSDARTRALHWHRSAPRTQAHDHTHTRLPTVERKGKCVHTATMAALRCGYSALLLLPAHGGSARAQAFGRLLAALAQATHAALSADDQPRAKPDLQSHSAQA